MQYTSSLLGFKSLLSTDKGMTPAADPSECRSTHWLSLFVGASYCFASVFFSILEACALSLGETVYPRFRVSRAQYRRSNYRVQ